MPAPCRGSLRRMSRTILDESQIHPAILQRVVNYERDLVDEVSAAVDANDVVIVGMAYNPHCMRAQKLLKSRGVEHVYLEYGGYQNLWRRRLALKMWTGWSTFPLCFHKGIFVGGADELASLLKSGELA